MTGEVFGVFIGGIAGSASAGKCDQGYSCGYHGLGHLIVGAIAGGIAGTAALAAAPEGNGRCTHRRRFKRALAGASVGTVIGVASLAAGGAGIPLAILSGPVTAAYALKPC